MQYSARNSKRKIFVQGVFCAMFHASKKDSPRPRRMVRQPPSMHIVPAQEAPSNVDRRYGMSGWQALAVIVVCVALMTVTFFLAPA
jgi:hypothetical protein